MKKIRLTALFLLLMALMSIIGGVSAHGHSALPAYGVYPDAPTNPQVGVYPITQWQPLMVVQNTTLDWLQPLIGNNAVYFRQVAYVQRVFNNDSTPRAWEVHVGRAVEFSVLVQPQYNTNAAGVADDVVFCLATNGYTHQFYESQLDISGYCLGRDGATGFEGYQVPDSTHAYIWDFFIDSHNQPENAPIGHFWTEGAEPTQHLSFTTALDIQADYLLYGVTETNAGPDGEVLYRQQDPVAFSTTPFLAMDFADLGTAIISECRADKTRLYFGNLTHNFVDTNTDPAVTNNEFVAMNAEGQFRVVENTTMLASDIAGNNGAPLTPCP